MQDQDFTIKFIGESYSSYAKDIHQIWCRSAKFCENPNSVQNQDQDQDHDITLDFNTRPTFRTWKTLTKFCLDPLTPSKVIVST